MSEFPEQIYRHSTYSTVRAWRERHGRYRLVGSRCLDCHQAWFPRRTVCGKCNSRNLEDYQCSHRGEIVCHWANAIPGLALLGYGEQVPRVAAIIRLDDGLHVLSEVIDAPPEAIEDGMGVRLVVRKQKRESNSNWMYGYKFVLDG